MTIFKPKQHSKTELAKSYLQYLNDSENAFKKYDDVIKRLSKANMVVPILFILVLIFTPKWFIYQNIYVFIFIGFVIGFFKSLEICIKSMATLMKNITPFLDKQRLEKIANQSVNTNSINDN